MRRRFKPEIPLTGLDSPRRSTLKGKFVSKDILTQQDGAILRVTINRPDSGNGMSNEMAVELANIFENAPPESQFIVLRGAGKDFCLGRAGMGQQPASQPEALELRRANEPVFQCYGSFRKSPIPIIGVVQGRAIGFGCALAALCDITIAADTAKFQFPEMGHNIMPTMAMSALVDRVPRKALLYLIYSAAVVDAQRALSFGIVSDVVPESQLDAAVDTLCATMSKAPAAATPAVKEYVRNALGMDVSSAVDLARNLHSVINSSSEMLRKRH
jgi:enoyl-CoA hydratase